MLMEKQRLFSNGLTRRIGENKIQEVDADLRNEHTTKRWWKEILD